MIQIILKQLLWWGLPFVLLAAYIWVKNRLSGWAWYRRFTDPDAPSRGGIKELCQKLPVLLPFLFLAVLLLCFAALMPAVMRRG